MKRVACSLFALALLTAPAFAQNGQDAMLAASERMQAAQAQAEADAIRPGDDALECDALQTEMQISMGSPEMQALSASMGANAQAQMDRAQDARGQMAGQMGVNMAMGLASSFVPGLGMIQGFMMQQQARSMQARAEQNQGDMAQSMDQMAQMMPAMMRGQRIYELAQAKQCAFLEQTAAPAE